MVITTLSPELLDAKWITDRHLRVVEWTRGTTRIAPISEAARKAMQNHLMGAGELLRSSALDPEPLFDEHLEVSQGTLFEDLV